MQSPSQRPIRSTEGIILRSHDTNKQNHDDHPDIHRASFYFLLVGIGYLFPFSALTQPVDYWTFLFPDFNMEFPLTTLYFWTNLIVLGGLVAFTDLDGTPASFTKRMVGGFVGQCVVLIVVPTSYFFSETWSETWNAAVILAATAVAAIVTAGLDSAVIALSAQYPLRVQEWLQVGVGVSTLIGSVYRDGTKLLLPSSTVASSLLYFYTGSATIALCIVAYWQLMKLDLTKQCLVKDMNKHIALLPPTEDTLDLLLTEESLLLPPEAQLRQSQSPTPAVALEKVAVNKWRVWKQIWFNELLVGLLFTSTLALWPPLVTEIPTHQFPQLAASGWWSLCLLTIFSIADCIGRILVRYRGPWTRHNIWIAVVARLGLIPIFLCLVVVGRKDDLNANINHGSWMWWWTQSDAVSISLVTILGATNGYVGTLCIVMVNECIPPHEQAMAGTFTSFALNTGLVVGATIGLILEKWISK